MQGTDVEIIQKLSLGVVINPMAGIGGPTGLKGSDGAATVDEALARGGELRAESRALRCLQQLTSVRDRLQVVTFAGAMGESVLQQAGIDARVIGQPQAEPSQAEDTRRAAQAFVEQGVDLILFVGGDGTARDICSVVGERIPVLGLPSGVKMHSGVFAVAPEAAAEVIKLMLDAQLVDLTSQEVRDIDETAFRKGVVKSRYYGDMLVPEVGQFVQQTKEGGREVEELVLDDIAADLIENLEDDTLYLVGPGTTPRALMEQLGLDNTLLGIDLVLNEEQVGKDLSGPEIEAYLSNFEGPVVAILTATGRQGCLLGRGNQQLTPAVLRRVGKESIWVIATKTKISELGGRPLMIDTNDPDLDQALSGYYRVVTGYRDAVIYPGSCGYGEALSLGE